MKESEPSGDMLRIYALIRSAEETTDGNVRWHLERLPLWLRDCARDRREPNNPELTAEQKLDQAIFGKNKP